MEKKKKEGGNKVEGMIRELLRRISTK